MKIPCEEKLDEYRQQSRCWWCGCWTVGCDPHHIEPKGMGSGKRMDIPANLIALCRLCHTYAENATRENGEHPLRVDCEAVVAKRLGTLQPEIRKEVQRTMQLPKGSEYVCPFTSWRWQAPKRNLKRRRA